MEGGGSYRRQRMGEISVEENDASVTASPGNRIVVTLPENPTTGYQWTVEALAGPVELESAPMKMPDRARPGAGGEREIVLRAGPSGQANVTLRLRREWEGDQPGDERFHFNVTVR
jgi:inhibitor of cysteine peptidase